MNKFLKAVLISFLVLVLAACTSKTDDQPTVGEETQQSDQSIEQFPVVVKDALGKEIAVKQQPTRIISLIPSNTEILFALGMGEKIVGVNDHDNYPPDVEKIEKIGGIEYNIEVIISLQPDLVVAHESGMYGLSDGVAQIEAAGIPVFVVKNAITFEETYETISELGQLTGTTEKAEEINKQLQVKLQEIATIVEKAEQKSAFVVVGVEPDIYVVGQNTYLNEMLEAANVKNVVEEAGWPVYSAEEMVASDADYVIATYASDLETLKANDLYTPMKAIQAGNLVAVDGDITSRQGPRLAEGVELIAKAIYPELFNE